MGWFGYRIYDGDGTFSYQADMLEVAGYKDGALVPSRSESEPMDIYSMDEGFIVSDEALAKVYKAYPKIMKKFGLDRLVELNARDFESKVLRKRSYDDNVLIPLTMVADFFIRHDAAMPGKLQDRAVQACKLLLETEHADEFNDPALRKRELRKHMRKMEQHRPKFRYFRENIAKMPAKKAAAKKM